MKEVYCTGGTARPPALTVLTTLLHRCPPQVAEKLTATASNEIEQNGIKATKLFTHREDVDQLNQQELASLPGKEKSFWGEDSHPSMEQNLNGLCPVPKELVLKVGAQVMLAKNISVQEGLVNGARGVIAGFDASRKGGRCDWMGGRFPIHMCTRSLTTSSHNPYLQCLHSTTALRGVNTRCTRVSCCVWEGVLRHLTVLPH